MRHGSSAKRYSGDNRLIPPKSPYRRGCLAPRCRLVASWGWSRSQGSGCSPVKAARELGSERRETVETIAVYKFGYLLENPCIRRYSFMSHALRSVKTMSSENPIGADNQQGRLESYSGLVIKESSHSIEDYDPSIVSKPKTNS